MESNTCGHVQYSVYGFWAFMDIDTTTLWSAACVYAVFTKIYYRSEITFILFLLNLFLGQRHFSLV